MSRKNQLCLLKKQSEHSLSSYIWIDRGHVFGAQGNLAPPPPPLNLSPFFVYVFKSKYIKIKFKTTQANFSLPAYIVPS